MKQMELCSIQFLLFGLGLDFVSNVPQERSPQTNSGHGPPPAHRPGPPTQPLDVGHSLLYIFSRPSSASFQPYLRGRESSKKMVQRLTYRKRHSYATKSNQHRVVKTPGHSPFYVKQTFFFSLMIYIIRRV